MTPEEFAGAVATEFLRIPLAPGGIVVQPSRGWTLVNTDTIVSTNAGEQDFAISVLGVPVNVRATPVRFIWSFDDESAPVVTTDPGRPWPHPTITHAYSTAGARTIRLTTEWSGEYQVAGAVAWQPIDGVATTAEAAPPLEVLAATNLLVTSP